MRDKDIAVRPDKITVVLWYGDEGQVIELDQDFDLSVRHRMGFSLLPQPSTIEVSGSARRVTEGRTYIKVQEEG